MEIFVFCLMFIIFSIGGGILYLIYLPFKIYLTRKQKLSRELSRKINIAYVLTILFTIIYITYDSLYPSESFYEEEFKTVTLREIPESAEFIEKSASYPDFKGEYCSSSQIKLSKSDYDKLLKELNDDKKITEEKEIVFFSEFKNTLKEKEETKIIKKFTRKIEGEEDHYLNIFFYNDEQTIFVNICVT
jgi:hypothetical protein